MFLKNRKKKSYSSNFDKTVDKWIYRYIDNNYSRFKKWIDQIRQKDRLINRQIYRLIHFFVQFIRIQNYRDIHKNTDGKTGRLTDKQQTGL